MKKIMLFALALALVGGAAYANYGARDTVPSSTLLVPYIIVDANASGVPLPNGQGYSTLTVVTNVSSVAQLIHVTVFAADSSTVIDFDEILSGYDVWSINWKDLVTGDFENFDTGSATAPLGATTPGGLNGFWNSPKYTATVAANAPSAWGPTTNTTTNSFTLPKAKDIDSLADSYGNYPNCGFPWGNLNGYASLIQTKLQAPLFPWPNQYSKCLTTGGNIKNWSGWLSTLTAQPLFFYAVIDTVNTCSGYFPGNKAYWGTLATNNVLTGYDFYMNLSQNYSESLPTVNIESATSSTGVGFYSEYKALAANLGNYADNHESLPTAWAFNYFQGGGATTEVGVWKNYQDFVYDTDSSSATYGAPLYVYACRPYIYYAFDESENSRANTSQTCPSGTFCLQPEPNAFPFQTQKVPVTLANFDGLMPGNGWMLLVFDPTINGADYSSPYYDNQFLQTFVFAKYNFLGFSTAVQATEMSNVWLNGSQIMPAFNTNPGAITQ